MSLTNTNRWKPARLLLAACVATLVGCGGGSDSQVTQLDPSGERASSLALAATEPADVRPLPTTRQIKNLQNEVITFTHFGINTYANREWGDTNYTAADIKKYNPTNFSAKQWVDAMEQMGSNTLVFVAKHHDGFANWRSDLNPDYSLKATPFSGDLVAELYTELSARGKNMGVYLSPWDYHYIHSGKFGNNEDPANTENLKPSESQNYLEYYKKQALEIKARAPKLSVIWLDGAGGDHMAFTPAQYKDLFRFLYDTFPGVNIQLSGVDIGWIGNEEGKGRTTQWNLVVKKPDAVVTQSADAFNPPQDVATVDLSAYNYSLSGGGAGKQSVMFQPLQADVRLVYGWFRNTRQPAVYWDAVSMYWDTVGKGAQLIVNYAPDQSGVIPADQVAEAVRMRSTRDNTFKTNLLKGATVTASSTVGKYGAANVLDGDVDTYWATPDGTSTATLTFTLPSPVKGDVIDLREYLYKGQRIGAFSVTGVRPDGSVVVLRNADAQTTVGARRFFKLDQIYELKELRVEFKGVRGAPLVSEVGFYKYVEEKSNSGAAAFTSKNGHFYGELEVEVTGPSGATINYTLDGSIPTATSPKYTGPIKISASTLIKVKTNRSATVKEKMFTKLSPALQPIAVAADAVRQSSTLPSGAAKTAVDGNTDGSVKGSMTHTAWSDLNPWWEADLGKLQPVDMVKVFNRTDCCQDRLSGARVVYSPVPFTSALEADAVALPGAVVQTLTGSKSAYSLYPGVNARYVRIYGNYGKPLHLAEVQFFGHAENVLAWDASTVKQSSTLDAASDSAAWWEGAIQNMAWMDTIEIYNRSDCCKDQLDGATVYISNEPFISASELQVANQQGRLAISLTGQQDVYRIKPQRFGKYIRVYSAAGKPLSLANVVVKGSQEDLSALPTQTLPFNVDSAIQSSTHTNKLASNAVDGTIDGSLAGISHTATADVAPWWSADQIMTNWISTIEINNRTDCCKDRLNGAKVYFSEKPFPGNATEADVAAVAGPAYTLDSSSATKYTVKVNRFGRYVRIYGKNGPLHMAEVTAKGVKVGDY